MASKQASHGGLGSQIHYFSVAPGQVATTFHRFPNLPAELQDHVWDCACAALETSPSVLCFKLKVFMSDEGRVVCFTPDAYTASSTRYQRGLLGACYDSREKALKSLNILTLYRYDASNRTGNEFRIPFDFEKTCFCIDGWLEHGINERSVERLIGMDFAKKIKRLAFVLGDSEIKDYDPEKSSHTEPRRELRCLAFLFHNAVQLGRINKKASVLGKFLSNQDFLSLFSLQPFAQKEMVESFFLTKPFGERVRVFDDAILLSFEGWVEKLRDAFQGADPRLYEALRRICCKRDTSLDWTGSLILRS